MFKTKKVSQKGLFDPVRGITQFTSLKYLCELVFERFMRSVIVKSLFLGIIRQRNALNVKMG